MSAEIVRIVLVDDHKVVRDSWKLLLENNPRFKVIDDCDNSPHAIGSVSSLLPDILLVDINMSPVNGFTVTETITKVSPSVKIIGLSVNNQPKYATRMLELGAKGYLTKTSPLEEINRGIIEVYKGGIYICEEVRGKMRPDELKRFFK
ncbi:MAG TPA: response regulator transcription factor [Chitinophagaceae bacterium]|nr:response regulator transcription factor [Chitinophagaceae bacterium]